MKSFPKDRLAIQLSSYSVLLPILLTVSLSLLLTACAGLSSSSQPGATTAPTARNTLSLAPATFDFGSVQLNSVGKSAVSVTNVGPSAETIESASVAPSPMFFTQGWTGAVTVAPGQTIQLQATFAPKAAGSYSGTLTLTMLKPLASISIPLTGEGSAGTGPPPVVAISVLPTSVSLQVGQSKQFTSAVTGTSNTAVTWTAVLGSISPSGDYTAPTVTSQTYDTVSVISVADSTKYASSSVTVTSSPSGGAAYSQNANSVTTKLLPSDIMSHCYGDTSNCAAGDAIAKCAMTDCGGLSEISNPTYMGQFIKASPGATDFATPVYYPTSSDPWYKITAATSSGVAQTITFHAPNGANFSSGVEQELGIWDQTTGYVVQLYADKCGSTQCPVSIPAASGCGSTSATACGISNTYQSAAVNLYTDKDYGYNTSPHSSNGIAPLAALTREQELMNGLIPHTLMITVDCVNQTTPQVFPANHNPAVCGIQAGSGPQNEDRPSSGTLLFLDYTPAQITSFNLPSWQTTILTAFATYGAYVSETQLGNTGINLVGDENLESSQPWAYYHSSAGCPFTAGTNCYNDTFWAWLTVQKGLKSNGDITQAGCSGGNPGGTSPTSTWECFGVFLYNIPRALGPEGSDSEGNSCTTGSGCYPSGHIHVADKCIAEGYAGVASGCF